MAEVQQYNGVQIENAPEALQNGVHSENGDHENGKGVETAQMKYKLRTEDNQILDITEEQLNLSEMLKNMIEEGVKIPEDGVQLKNITADIMKKVLEYCSHKISSGSSTEEWRNEFLKLDPPVLESLWAAANFLIIPDLMDLVADYVIDHYIKDKPIEEIREVFGIVNDFTPEEEAEIRRQNEEWFNFDDEDENEEEDDDDDDEEDFNN